ncbi:hypothetical protein [Sorangium sp. So ce204]|uniref:hypothetical protein n=1 Tax=Sorangium sp. So ce204 TaxID=3133288 RepID=UPI003F5F12AE
MLEGPAVVLADMLHIPTGIAVDSINVYWAARYATAVTMVPKAGGLPASLDNLDEPGSIRVAVHSSTAYYTTPFRVGSILIGGIPSDMNVIYSGFDIYGMAVDSTFVYWTIRRDTDPGTGMVMRSFKDGSALFPLAVGQNYPINVTVDSASVYWANSGERGTSLGSVMKVPITGGTPTALATNQAEPHDIAVDSSDVYWTNSGDGTVMKVPVDGGTPTAIARGQSGPRGIAVDSTSVYWTNYSGGTVMKIRK